MPGGNTRTILYFDPFPLCMVRGEGCHLFDADGHRYVDLLGEYTAGIFGHSNPVIRKAIIDALNGGISLSAHNEAENRLANLIRERYASMELVRFTNSGTEANLMAIATAIAFTGRRRILVFAGAYHGSVLQVRRGSLAHQRAARFPDRSLQRHRGRAHAPARACGRARRRAGRAHARLRGLHPRGSAVPRHARR